MLTSLQLLPGDFQYLKHQTANTFKCWNVTDDNGWLWTWSAGKLPVLVKDLLSLPWIFGLNSKTAYLDFTLWHWPIRIPNSNK